jgi:hypothetical protein
MARFGGPSSRLGSAASVPDARPRCHHQWVINTRDGLIEAAKPLLEPDEHVAHVIRALEGPSRWLAMGLAMVVALGSTLLLQGVAVIGLLAFALVYTRLYARRVIMATDKRVVVLAGGRWRFKPRAILDSLDLETRIGPPKGLWLEINLNGRRMFVVPRTVKEVQAADADLDV